MIKKPALILLLMILLINACSVQGVFSGTRLKRIAYQKGDLTSEFIAGISDDEAPKFYKELPHAQQVHYRQILKGTDVSGGVTLFQYDSSEDLDAAYKWIVYMLEPGGEFNPKVGEKSMASYIGPDFTFGEVVFVRCNMLVHIRLTNISEPGVVVQYAQRLDARLQESICPSE